MRQPIFVLYSICVLFSSVLFLASFSFNAFEEYGKAGYYSDALQGRKTASGVKYNKKAFTCAHKTLPYGTKLRVTRLDNKLAVIVSVNDRGPYKDGFVIDLSRAAAEEINLIKSGIANVKIEVIPTESSNAKAIEPVTYSSIAPRNLNNSNTTTRLLIPQSSATSRPITYSTQDPRPVTIESINENKPGVATAKTAKNVKQVSSGSSDLFKVQMKKTAKTGVGIQVSTLFAAENVLPEVTKLEKTYPGKVMVSVVHEEATSQATYRIILGPYADRKSAEKQQKLLLKKAFPKCFIVVLNEL